MHLWFPQEGRVSIGALLAVMNSSLAEAYPVTSTPTVATSNGGACNGADVDTPASILVSWTITNSDPNNFTAKLYENGILKLSQATNAGMSWPKTISGAVVDGPTMPWNANWIYRVDIVENTTGSVVSSKSSAEWTQAYGGCRSGGGL